MVKKLLVVSCGYKKIFERYPYLENIPARKVYIGSFSRAMIEYGDKFFGDNYVILSAKYGFIYPYEIIPKNYNVTFNDPSTKPVTVEELKQQIKQKQLDKYDIIFVMGGERYLNMVTKAFEGKQIIDVFENIDMMGIIISKLINAVKTDKPLKYHNFIVKYEEE